MTEFRQTEPSNHSLGQDPVTDALYKNTLSKTQDSSPEAIAQTNPDEGVTLTEETPYETIKQGPITYFRYYFENAEQSSYLTSDLAEPIASKNLLPFYLAGGGVLGATLISGIVIAGFTDNSKSPTPKELAPSEVKKTPKPRSSQRSIAPPEIMQERLTTKPSPKAKQTPANFPSTVPKVQSSERLLQQALAIPEPLPVPSLPSTWVKSIPTPPLPIQVKPTTSQTVSPAQAVLAVSASTSSSPSPKNDVDQPLISNNADSNQADLPLIAEDQTLKAADARCLNRAEKPLTATVDQTIAAQASMLVSAPETLAIPSTTQKAEVKQGTAVNASTLPQGEAELQAFLELPQRFPGSTEIAVMPLPCQVAQTALTKRRKDRFTVLTLSLQDYQKHWQSSSKTRRTLPAYGFIDYKQQLIVLLNER
jgi:hypothetical protein